VRRLEVEDVCGADADAAATGKSQMSAKEAFMKFDKDNDGSLTFDEMVFAMRAMGITMDKDKLKVVFDEYDSDKSGTIDFPEFVLLMDTGKEDDDEAGEEAELKAAFDDCDRDGNKQLELDELKDIMTEFGVDMPDEEVREMFADADTDNSGSISFDEFKRLMLSKE